MDRKEQRAQVRRKTPTSKERATKLPEVFPIKAEKLTAEYQDNESDPFYALHQSLEVVARAHASMPEQALSKIESLCLEIIHQRFRALRKEKRPLWTLKVVCESTDKKVRYAAQILEAIFHIRKTSEDLLVKADPKTKSELTNLMYNWANLCNGYACLRLFQVEEPVAKTVKQKLDASRGGRTKADGSRTSGFQAEVEALLKEHPHWSLTAARKQVAGAHKCSLTNVALYTHDPKVPKSKERKGLRKK